MNPNIINNNVKNKNNIYVITPNHTNKTYITHRTQINTKKPIVTINNKKPVVNNDNNKKPVVIKANNKNPVINANNKNPVVINANNKLPIVNNANNKNPVVNNDNNKNPVVNNDNNKNPVVNKESTKQPIKNANNILPNATIDNVISNTSNTPFDIVICHGPNDNETLYTNIFYARKNIIGFDKIYVITHNPDLKIDNLDNCIVIPENKFPFTISTIKNYIHSTNNRHGWYLQQLLKLYFGSVVPTANEYYLVIDCDTIFLKPTQFFDNNIPLYNLGDEYHEPYFEHMTRLHHTLTKQIKESAICHHMVFSKNILKQLFRFIETYHNKPFWQTFLECVHKEHYNLSGASEYELYLTYLLIYHKHTFKIRTLNWKNTTELITDAKFDYISAHWYSRNTLPKTTNTNQNLKISALLKEGLCNHMFQVACAYALSIKHNKEFVIVRIKNSPHSKINYFTNIFRKVNTDWNLTISNTYREISRTEQLYTEIPNFDCDTMIDGYFQNYRYIHDYRDKILELFKIEDDRELRLKQLYPDINNSYFLHIRRGDYVNNLVHELKLDNYYLKALDTIRTIEQDKPYNIYVFSNDIEYCKNLNWLIAPNIHFIENLDEVDSLYLMNMCNKGAICCNSSYSWWGSYMIKNPNKTVIFPNKWYSDDTRITEIGWPGAIVLSI